MGDPHGVHRMGGRRAARPGGRGPRGDHREDPRPLRAPSAGRPGDHRALRALRRAGRPGEERPVWLLNATRAATNFFQWSRDAGDRLAFAEVLSSGASFAAPMEETYRLL